MLRTCGFVATLLGGLLSFAMDSRAGYVSGEYLSAGFGISAASGDLAVEIWNVQNGSSSQASGSGKASANAAPIQVHADGVRLVGTMSGQVWQAPARAKADVSSSVEFSITNNSADTVTFLLTAYFGVGTGVEVDPLTELALYGWDIGGSIGPYYWGEVTGYECSRNRPDRIHCSNFFDDGLDEAGWELDPGEALIGELHLYASFDLRAVDEPWSLMLAVPGLLGLAALRRGGAGRLGAKPPCRSRAGG